jgi:hypothetical protein
MKDRLRHGLLMFARVSEQLAQVLGFSIALALVSDRLGGLLTYPDWTFVALGGWLWTVVAHVWAEDPRPARVATGFLTLSWVLDLLSMPEVMVAVAGLGAMGSAGWAHRLGARREAGRRETEIENGGQDDRR